MVKICSIASDSWLDFLPRNCGTVIPQWNSNAFTNIDTPEMPIDKGFHLARAPTECAPTPAGERVRARRRTAATRHGLFMIQVANYTTPILNEALVANSELYLIDSLNIFNRCR
jgi:hypothetical protein